VPVFILEKEISFPPVHLAGPDGLLAMGGDLSPERILLAYRMGIFPWYEGDPILWWCPDPRFVLFPRELKISKSMKKALRKYNLPGSEFAFTVNQAFEEVINHCKMITRKDQDGTWITDDVKKAYTLLHKKGVAHSAETWKNDKLIGGLYGIKLGKVFFGESMFSLEPNASKAAFIQYVQQLRSEGIELIDCQVYTEHLESLGARMIPRKEFSEKLKQLIPDDIALF
jgi:leucyl/phenylalanyl-tRNA---protein transferase